MGNVHNKSDLGANNKRHRSVSNKNELNVNSMRIYEKFIIKHNKSNCFVNSNINNINICCSKRVVFISLIGLYRTWRDCPPYILYSSLLIIPLKREWIYSPNKYKQELKSSIFGQISLFQTDKKCKNTFFELLKWKDCQGFVFWALDDYKQYNENNTDSLIAPFWKYLSLKLTNLYNPVTRGRYNEINIELIKKNISNNKSKYDVSIPSVLRELYFMTMKYKTMQEIIFQSNPESLNPICSYNANNLNNINNDGNIDGDWWISCDYDPYCVDHDIN